MLCGRTAAHYVLNLHRRRRRFESLCNAIDNLAFTSDENVLSLGKENLFRFSGLIRETEKLQRNWGLCRDSRDLIRLGIIRAHSAGSQRWGISTSACDTKMFLPDPSYLICSVASQLLQM